MIAPLKNLTWLRWSKQVLLQAEHVMVVSIFFIMIGNHFPGITFGGAPQLGYPRGIDHARLDCCKVFQEGLIKRFAGTLAGVRPKDQVNSRKIPSHEVLK